MNTCVLLFTVTVIFKTAAQNLPIFFTSTEINSVQSSEDDIDDIFRDDEVIEYTSNNLKESVTVHNESLGTSERFSIHSPKPNSKDFDFDDWDLINEDESTLYEEFNQTMLNGINGNNIGAVNVVNTPKPQPFTTPLSTLYLDSSMFESEEDETPPQTTTEEDKTSSTLVPPIHGMLELDPDIFETDKPETPTPSSTPTPSPTSTEKVKISTPSTTASPPDPMILEIELDIFESEEPGTPSPTTVRTTTQITTEPVTSSEEDYFENTNSNEIEPVTDDPDDDPDEQNDPCNYLKFPRTIPTIEKTGRRVSDIKCEEYMWYYKLEVLDAIKKQKECDEKMENQKLHVTQVFGGFKALQGDFPHMGAVGWILETGDIKWMCGSSLISPWFTLTAAHCRRAPSKIKLHRENREPELVRFGSVFLDNKIIETRDLMAKDVYIAEFLVLDEYAKNPIKKYNDIGLIRLKTEVNMQLHIKPACLWTQFESLGNSWVANITGWGKTSYKKGSESNYLKYAEIDYVEHNTCRRYIHGRRNRHWPEGLLDHQLCAGKLQGGIDACQGDSGGPLQIRSPTPAAMNNSDEIHHVVGITSFGIKCGYPFLPGVYTNIASFLCWIEKNVWPEENNTFCP